MDYEEDTYSEIFSAMKHPMRRKILLTINESPSTYTEIMNSLGIDTGLLNYHLDAMRQLVTKNKDGRYTPSEYGSAAVILVSRMESSVKKSRVKILELGLSRLYILIIIVLVLANGLLIYRDQSLQSEKMYTLGEAIRTSKNLITDSLNLMNYTLQRGNLNGVPLERQYSDFCKLSIGYEYISTIDVSNREYWLKLSDAATTMADFTLALKERTDIYTVQGSINGSRLNNIQRLSLNKIKSDLLIVQRAFQEKVDYNNILIIQTDLESAAKAADSVESDINYALEAFGVGIARYPGDA